MERFELIQHVKDGRVALEYADRVDESEWLRTGQVYEAEDYYDAVAQVDTSNMFYKSTYGYYYI